MTYTPDMPAAAHRHLEAADLLAVSATRADVAGYLYGIAAECAIKAMMLETKMFSTDPSQRAGNPLYVHFPTLRTMLRDTLQGRRGTPLFRFVNNDNFMSNWAIEMRYAKGSCISSKWVNSWAKQAQDAVGAIGT